MLVIIQLFNTIYVCLVHVSETEYKFLVSDPTM